MLEYLFDWDPHNHRDGHQNPVSSSFRSKVTVDCVSAVDDRHERAAMSDCSSNMTSKRKIDRSGVSGMSISGGIDTTLWYLLDPKLLTNTR